MEGMEDYAKSIFKWLIILFGLTMFIIAGIQRETIKDLEKDLFRCEVKLEVYE